MTYISTEEIEALPDDPLEAFVAFERVIRGRYQDEYDKLDGLDSVVPILNAYVAQVQPAARYYGITKLAEYPRPQPGDANAGRAFMSEVDYHLTELRLHNVARAKQNSVALDAATKIKLRHLLGQITETVDKLEISLAKRETLYKKIRALGEEIDRDRTGAQAFGALAIEVFQELSEAAEPLIRQVERLGAALGVAIKTEASQAKLPPPKEQKRIEPPKPSKKANGFNKSLNDEIPF